MSYYWHARREPLPPGTKVSRDVVRRVWGFARDFAGRSRAICSCSPSRPWPRWSPPRPGAAQHRHPPGQLHLVNLIGLAAVGVAVANAGFALGQRSSSRIGLIYQLRTSLFDHVQRQPLAFFTHTQTGAHQPPQHRRGRCPAGPHRHRVGLLQPDQPGHHPGHHVPAELAHHAHLGGRAAAVRSRPRRSAAGCRPSPASRCSSTRP